MAIAAGTVTGYETQFDFSPRETLPELVYLFASVPRTGSTYVSHLLWATGYNVFALPLAAGVLAPFGIILSPAVGALLMSLSTIIVAINAQLLRGLRLANTQAV